MLWPLQLSGVKTSYVDRSRSYSYTRLADLLILDPKRPIDMMTFAKQDAGNSERAGPVQPKPGTNRVDLNMKLGFAQPTYLLQTGHLITLQCFFTYLIYCPPDPFKHV